MHVGVIFLSLYWLTIALFGFECACMCVCVCVLCKMILSLPLSVMHTPMESCQRYWERKTGVQADKNVLLLVVRRVNSVRVDVAGFSSLPAHLVCFMGVGKVR